jgi:hypothetical protein
MSKPSLLVAVFSFVLGLAGTIRAEEAAKTSTAPAAECPHMKAMREAQEQGKGGECPHMKDGKPCDCPHHKGMTEGKEGGGCPHMKDGKPCDCPHCKAAAASQGDKPGKQPAKMNKPAGKKGAKASPEAEAKGAKE